MAAYVTRKPEVRVATKVQRLRAFPALGQVNVEPGSTVDWETTLGEYSSRQRLRFVRVESSGDEIAATVLVGVGQKVKRGEVLAYYSFLFGLGYTEYISPCDGEVVDVSQTLSAISIKEALVPLRSHIPGKVESVDDAFGARVLSEGDLVYGTTGAGYGRSGILQIKAKSPKDDVRPSDLSVSDAGKVLVVGKSVTQELLEACLKWRVAGIVGGSISSKAYEWYRDISEKLDWDEFLARYWARELKDKSYKVPPPMEIATSLVITEGFGDVAMNDTAFEVLSRHAGERVFLDGSGAFRSQAAGSDETVPCVFIPSTGTIAEGTTGAGCAISERTVEVGAAGPTLAELGIGDRVKVYRLGSLPQEAKILEIGAGQLENGLSTPATKVAFNNGKEEWVPLANVEKAD